MRLEKNRRAPVFGDFFKIENALNDIKHLENERSQTIEDVKYMYQEKESVTQRLSDLALNSKKCLKKKKYTEGN